MCERLWMFREQRSTNVVRFKMSFDVKISKKEKEVKEWSKGLVKEDSCEEII